MERDEELGTHESDPKINAKIRAFYGLRSRTSSPRPQDCSGLEETARVALRPLEAGETAKDRLRGIENTSYVLDYYDNLSKEKAEEYLDQVQFGIRGILRRNDPELLTRLNIEFEGCR
jgi:hypothetical protein